MNKETTVYLAGPEVFFPEDIRVAIDSRKKAILAEHGLKGLSPMDKVLDLEGVDNPAQRIYNANQDLMKHADCLIANLTPFRGPSGDAGTIYELGYMIALGKPAVGFTVCATPYCDRVSPGAAHCEAGADIEPFGLCDNLMLDCGLAAAGGKLIHGDRPYPAGGFKPEAFFDETVFERGVELLQRLLSP